MDLNKIDTTNKFVVGGTSGGVRVLAGLSPQRTLTEEEALNLAAYLVAIAGTREKFLQVLDAIERA